MLQSLNNQSTTIHGWIIQESRGGNFLASNDSCSIHFLAEGRAGVLHTVVKSVFDYDTKRLLQAPCFTTKFNAPIRIIAEQLAEQGFLWDYEWSKPFLETWYKLNPRDTRKFI